ncbi:MAG: 30S ribosomal protein S17e [Candidatus Pacearchaeota archaeon]|nr:30S ribosomal protein S17e [Candidatus Pacearchaeota archaeon]
MGRIKSLLIKRTSKQLIEEGIPFTSSFETNKKLLGNTMPSKPLRNKIAGYIARLKRIEMLKKANKTNLLEETTGE